MLKAGDVVGGIVVESSELDEVFDARFTEAMHSAVDDARRRELTAGAHLLGKIYDMGAFTDQYISLYDDVMRRFAASRPISSTDIAAADLRNPG